MNLFHYWSTTRLTDHSTPPNDHATALRFQ
jgi:hypothetical protein